MSEKVLFDAEKDKIPNPEYDNKKVIYDAEEEIKKKEAENMAPVLRVRHRKYGEGILLSQNELTVEVEFPGYGRKQFLKALGEIEFLSQETGETYGK